MIDPSVHMIPVKSSNIEEVGYDQSKGVLHVKFRGGAHYSYEGVPPDINSRLHGSESIGRFIHENVKGKFRHRKH